MFIAFRRQSTLNVHVAPVSATAVVGADDTLGPMGAQYESVAIADVDGDGVVEVAASRYTGGLVEIFEHAPGWPLLASVRPSNDANEIAFEDWTNDGVLDLVTARSTAPATIDVTPGVGGGALLTYPQFAASAQISGAEVADFDGDGRQDVAVTRGAGPAAVEIHLGQADGTFVLSQALVDIHFATSLITSGDVNHDGHLDLIVADSRIYVLYGDVTGQFTIGPYLTFPGGVNGVYFADVDGDALEDLVVSSPAQSKVFPGDGTYFSATGTNIGDSTWKGILAVVDVDADGELDLLTRAGSAPPSGVAWLPGQPGIAFGAPQTIQTTFKVDDFALVTPGALPRRWLFAGPTGLHDLLETSTGPVDALVHAIPSRSVAHADVDDDGELDAITSGEVLTISRGSAGGALSWDGLTRLVGGPTQALHVTDTNGDGMVDLVAVNKKAGFTIVRGVAK